MLGWAVMGTLRPIRRMGPCLLGAMGCFSRSSKRMHGWSLEWPVVGEELRVWEDQGAISTRAKLWTTVVMIGLVAIPMFFRSIAVLWKVAAMVVTVAVVGFVWSRPKPRPTDTKPSDGD